MGVSVDREGAAGLRVPQAQPHPPVPVRRKSLHPRDIRSDDLRYLLAVVRTGQFALAADDLQVGQTTVARRIRSLERTLGVRVLEPSPQGWVLTDIGKGIAARAEAVEAAVCQTAAHVSSDAPVLRGTVRVGAPDGFGAVFVAPALARLHAGHPELRVELITATKQLSSFRHGLDIAVTVGDRHSNRQHRIEPLASYGLGLFATEHYLASHGEPATVSELEQHSVIFYVDSLQDVADLNVLRYLPGPAEFAATSVFAQVEATLAGGGIGLLPHFLARGKGLRQILPTAVAPTLRYALASRSDNRSSATAVVRAAIQSEVARRADELT